MSSSKAAARTSGAKARKPLARKSAVKAPARKAAPAKRSSATKPTNGAAALAPQMTEMAILLEKALRAGDLAGIPAEPLQQLIAAAAKAYSAKREAGEEFHPVSRAGRLTPTDIMVTANGLLRSGNLQIFELGMWQSWTGD